MKRRWHMAWVGLLLLWVAYAIGGARVAHIAARKLGGVLVRIAEGKFNDPALFVQNRLREALWLLTLAFAWAVFQVFFDRFAAGQQCSVRLRWVWRSLVGFVLLNTWIACAMQTVLFWAVLGAGAGGNSYMQFQFKRLLAGEVRAPAHAVLVGSSQTRAQIDENLLNEKLGAKLWTTELHYPGSKASDLLLVAPQLDRAHPDLVICYFNETYFFTGSHSEIPPAFLTFAQVPELWRSGALRYLSADEVSYGLVGAALPIFRCRSVISQRLLGHALLALPQARYNASLEVDLETRARESAPGMKKSDESEFQKRAMEKFVQRCEKAGRRVVLLKGGVNPVWERHIDPAVRADTFKFLDELKSRHSNLVVIPETEFSPRSSEDYEDLTHVNRAVQQRYTERLAEVLVKFNLVK